MLNLAMSFFCLNDIAINAKKTVLMVINPGTDPLDDPLLFGFPVLPSSLSLSLKGPGTWAATLVLMGDLPYKDSSLMS